MMSPASNLPIKQFLVELTPPRLNELFIVPPSSYYMDLIAKTLAVEESTRATKEYAEIRPMPAVVMRNLNPNDCRPRRFDSSYYSSGTMDLRDSVFSAASDFETSNIRNTVLDFLESESSEDMSSESQSSDSLKNGCTSNKSVGVEGKQENVIKPSTTTLKNFTLPLAYALPNPDSSLSPESQGSDFSSNGCTSNKAVGLKGKQQSIVYPSTATLKNFTLPLNYAIPNPDSSLSPTTNSSSGSGNPETAQNYRDRQGTYTRKPNMRHHTYTKDPQVQASVMTNQTTLVNYSEERNNTPVLSKTQKNRHATYTRNHNTRLGTYNKSQLEDPSFNKNSNLNHFYQANRVSSNHSTREFSEFPTSVSQENATRTSSGSSSHIDRCLSSTTSRDSPRHQRGKRQSSSEYSGSSSRIMSTTNLDLTEVTRSDHDKFDTEVVTNSIQSVMSETIGEIPYEPFTCRRMSQTLSNDILARLQTLRFPNYKFVVMVSMGNEDTDALGLVQFGSRCLWNTETDKFVDVRYKNGSLFVVALIYALCTL